MRKLAILTFVTLDGVMQGPSSPQEDPSDGFEAGGWAQPHWGEVMEQVRAHAMREPYDLLLGRTTYNLFAPHFASNEADGDLESRRLNEATKYVVTSKSEELDWPETRQITGDVSSEIARLKQQDGPLLQVHGSWRLIQTLLASDLIDEFRLWTFPALAGDGKRLFAGGTVPTQLRLLKTDPCPGGAVMSVYGRV